MYEEFFHFSTHPFRNSPDPSFFFRSASHREALAMLGYGIREGKGFMLVTGDVGTGKTMLVQALKTELGENVVLVEVAYPWVSAEEILASIRARVGLPAVAPEGPEAIEGLRERLMALADEGRQVVLVIDEAHQLPVKTLEGIRLISNVESTTRKLLQIVLLGQEELGTLLSQYSLRQVQQRIALTCHLRPLDRAETAEYIRHRLRIANGNAELFSAGAADQVFAYSGGCPRLINQACDYCLLYAFGKFAPAVGDALAREALSNMVAARVLPQMKAAEPGLGAPPEVRFDRPMAQPGASAAAAESAALPFTIPGKRPAEELLHHGGRSDSRNLVVMGGILLFLALGLAAVSLWLALNRGAESPVRAVGSGRGSGSEAPSARPEVQAPPLASASRLGLGLPVNASAPGAKVVETSRDLSLALLASQHFGAWNATVRDLLEAANPQLGNFEALPVGSRVSMPLPTRSAMLMSDPGGQFYIYFASFDSEEAARAELEPLQRVWTNATILAAERRAGRIFRIYVGPFGTRAEGENVAAALWFKFLPVLSQDRPAR